MGFLLKLLWTNKPSPSLGFMGVVLIAFGIALGTLYVMWSTEKGANIVNKARIISLQGALKQVEAIGQAQQQASKATVQAANRAIMDQKEEYNVGLAAIKGYYETKLINQSAAIKRLQRNDAGKPDSSSTCGMPSKTAGTELLNEGPTDQVSSRRSLEEQCTITTWMLLKFQEHERVQQQIYGWLPEEAPSEHEAPSDSTTNGTQ